MNYPNGMRKSVKQIKSMSHANRGIGLENDICATNLHYLFHQKAVFHKKPTPIQVVRTDYKTRGMCKITEAYYKQPSQLDYNGVYKGHYVEFEAKETKNKTSFPLKNIHQHQIDHMKSVIKQSGICFLFIRLGCMNTYLIDAETIIEYWDYQNKEGGRKSIPKETFEEKAYLIPYTLIIPVDFLPVIDKVYLRC